MEERIPLSARHHSGTRTMTRQPEDPMDGHEVTVAHRQFASFDRDVYGEPAGPDCGVAAVFTDGPYPPDHGVAN